MLKDDLRRALVVAIDAQMDYEQGQDYLGPSVFLGGLREVEDAINRGEEVVIK